MQRRPSSLQAASSPQAHREEERARLVVALRNAGPEFEAAAAVLSSGGHQAALRPDGLDDVRTLLLTLLFRRSNDFTATTALKALDTFSAGLRPQNPVSVSRRSRRRRRVPGSHTSER